MRTNRNVRKLGGLGGKTFRSVGFIVMNTTASVGPEAGTGRAKSVCKLRKSEERERGSDRKSNHSEWWSALKS